MTLQAHELIDKFRATDADYHIERRKSPLYSYFRFPELPALLTERQHSEMQRASRSIALALSFSAELLLTSKLELDGEPLWSWLDIPSDVQHWIRKYHRPNTSVFWGRPDFLFENGAPRLLEANLASAAGYQMQAASLGEYYARHPALHEIRGAFFENPLHAMAQVLGRSTRPGQSILFADIFERKRYSADTEAPYLGMIEYLSDISDLRVISAFIKDLEFGPQGAFSEGRKIDHVFLSYYNPHVFDRFGEFLPFWDLHAQEKLGILDSLTEILLSNKLLLGFLSEYIDELPFPMDLKREFHRFVPWTRIVRPCRTQLREKGSERGEVVDLYDIALKRQEDWVLKKAQSAESAEVYLGRSLSEKAWKELLQEAFAAREWILQRYVDAEFEPVWHYDDGVLKETRAQTVFSPYLAQGAFAGYCTRYFKESASPESPGAPAHSVNSSSTDLIGTAMVLPSA